MKKTIATIVLLGCFTLSVNAKSSIISLSGYARTSIDNNFTNGQSVSGNVTANAFIGNGSELTGITGTSQWVGTENIYFTSGNVGIGTSSPIWNLDVNGNARFQKIILEDAESFTRAINFGANGFNMLRNNKGMETYIDTNDAVRIDSLQTPLLLNYETGKNIELFGNWGFPYDANKLYINGDICLGGGTQDNTIPNDRQIKITMPMLQTKNPFEIDDWAGNRILHITNDGNVIISGVITANEVNSETVFINKNNVRKGGIYYSEDDDAFIFVKY